MDTMKPFEVPTDMRKFAEQSVDQARQAFDGFIAAANWREPPDARTS